MKKPGKNHQKLPKQVRDQVLLKIFRLPTKNKSNRLSRWLNGDKIEAVKIKIGNTDRRASVWVNDLIFDSSLLPPGFRRQTWGDTLSSSFIAEQSYYLLEKWRDQRGRLDELKRIPVGNGQTELP